MYTEQNWNGVVHIWESLGLWMRRMVEWGKGQLWMRSKKTAGYGGSSIQTSQISPWVIRALPLPHVSEYICMVKMKSISISRKEADGCRYKPFADAFWYVSIFFSMITSAALAKRMLNQRSKLLVSRKIEYLKIYSPCGFDTCVSLALFSCLCSL